MVHFGDFYPSFDMAYYEKLLHFWLRGKANQEDVQGAEGKSRGCRRHGEKAHILIMDEPFIGKDMFTQTGFHEGIGRQPDRRGKPSSSPPMRLMKSKISSTAH